MSDINKPNSFTTGPDENGKFGRDQDEENN